MNLYQSPRFCSVCGTPLRRQYVEDEERERAVCPACGTIHYVNPKIVAGTLPVVEGRVWLLRRAIEPRYGFWTYPAGFAEMQETMEEAAARETREELGADVEVGALLGVYSRRDTPTVLLAYLGTLLSTPRGGRETLEFRLFLPGEIPWDDLAFWNTHAALHDWVSTLPD